MTRPDAMQEFDATSGGTFGRETSNAENWPAPVVAIEERAAKAEPFEETIEAFRLRVVLKGGRVEEHYVFRKIEQLEEALRAATARIRQLETVNSSLRDRLAGEKSKRRDLLAGASDKAGHIGALRRKVRRLYESKEEDD